MTGAQRDPAATGVLDSPRGWRGLWNRWTKTARALGVVQTRALMVACYFVFVFPVGLVMRGRGDPLRLRPPQGTNWRPYPNTRPTIEAARKQA
jgi:hypothetical protein